MKNQTKLQSRIAHMIRIASRPVGDHFGCVGVASRDGDTLELVSDTKPLGFDEAARKAAYDLAREAGWIVEIGEMSVNAEATHHDAAHRAGVQILLDRRVVVDARAPGAHTYDWGGRFEASLALRDGPAILGSDLRGVRF